jgi:hypothetical protein
MKEVEGQSLEVIQKRSGKTYQVTGQLQFKEKKRRIFLRKKSSSMKWEESLMKRGILSLRYTAKITKANNISTLKININKNKEQKVKELLRIQRIDQSQLKTKKELKFYDPALDQIKKKKEKKKANAFVFIEKGTFIKNRKEQTAKLLGIDLSKTQLTVK